MHVGDTFASKSTPIIDAMNGGSAVEYPKTLAQAAAGDQERRHDHRRSHRPSMTSADLKEYAAFNNDFITWVQGEIKAGKSVDQASMEYKVPEKYAGYTVSTFLGGIKGNIQLAYDELQKK